MSDIASLVSTVGFPIVSFLIAGYFIKYTYDKSYEKDSLRDEREEEHWKSLSELTQAVSENSTAIRELIQEVREENDSQV